MQNLLNIYLHKIAKILINPSLLKEAQTHIEDTIIGNIKYVLDHNILIPVGETLLNGNTKTLKEDVKLKHLKAFVDQLSNAPALPLGRSKRKLLNYNGYYVEFKIIFLKDVKSDGFWDELNLPDKKILGVLEVNIDLLEIEQILYSNLSAPNIISELQKIIDNAKNTVEHELIHVHQSYINREKNTDLAGTPSKKHHLKETEDTPHALLAVEFYPKLQDCINETKAILDKYLFLDGVPKLLFNYLVNIITEKQFIRELLKLISKLDDKSEDKDFLRYLMTNYNLSPRTHKFFKDLKNNNLPLYKKAVSVMLKEFDYCLK